MMRRHPFFFLTLILVLCAGMSQGCGDDNGVEPQPLTIADFAGSWNCTAFVVTSSANPQIQFDLIAAGGALSVTVQPSGNFNGSITYPDPQTFQPTTVQIAGTFTLVSQTEIRAEFNPEIPPLLENDTVAFTLSGSTLTLSDDTSEFDFDFDGQYEAATFLAVLVTS
jgi:hypothetical protein